MEKCEERKRDSYPTPGETGLIGKQTESRTRLDHSVSGSDEFGSVFGSDLGVTAGLFVHGEVVSVEAVADGVLHRVFGRMGTTLRLDGSHSHCVTKIDDDGLVEIRIGSRPSFTYYKNKQLPVGRVLKLRLIGSQDGG